MSETLQRAWQQGGALSGLLLPLSWLFGAVAAIRRGLYRAGLLASGKPPVPVIVVGNITVGGAGKSPLVIELATRLRAAGYRPGVVSRGYGGREHPAPYRVRGDEPAAVCGDEPLLIARRSACPVVVWRDRRGAAEALVEQTDCDLVLADDGLQHYALARDIEIVVVDGRRRFGNGRLLPAGPLREPLGRLRQAEFVWINNTGVDPRTSSLGYRLVATEACPLVGGECRALAGFRDRAVHAVAGIGAPQRFFETLREHGLAPIEHPFPDHHDYVAGDLAFADDLPVLMTEKDAVKCEAFARPNWYAVPVRADLPPADWTALLERVGSLTGGSAADNR